MITVTRINVRENVSIPFWSFTQEQLDKIKITYDDPGHRLSYTVTLLEDGLVQKTETVWNSVESWEEYNTEFTSAWKERDLYNLENRIISRRAVE